MNKDRDINLNNYGKQLISYIKDDIFPSNAEFDEVPLSGNGDYICKINWLLQTDNQRPNKRSKTIKIIISQEALEECPYTENRREKFITHIKQKYSSFLSDHSNSKFQEPPEEIWIIESQIFN